MTWQQAEQIALDKDLWAVSASLIANCKILYAKSDNEKKRFDELRKKTARSEDDNIHYLIEQFKSSFSAIEYIQLARSRNDLVSAQCH